MIKMRRQVTKELERQKKLREKAEEGKGQEQEQMQ